jgi:Fe2+ or Zn2+ uptake regulation protein
VNARRKRERLRQFKQLCRRHGLPLTVQRWVILENVLDRTDQPTADQIYGAVKDHLPGISRTTVYRVLGKLVEIDVITKTSSPGAATRFDPMTHCHHHLVCLQCDRLIDLEDEHVPQRVGLPDVRAHSFEIRDFSIHFRGICAACRQKLRAQRRAAPDRPSRPRKRIVRTKSQGTRKRKTQSS